MEFKTSHPWSKAKGTSGGFFLGIYRLHLISFIGILARKIDYEKQLCLQIGAGFKSLVQLELSNKVIYYSDILMLLVFTLLSKILKKDWLKNSHQNFNLIKL